MYTIQIHIDIHGQGFFSLNAGGYQVGKIVITLSGSELILQDTTVLGKRYLHSVRNRLLHEVVEYAKMHELKIVTVSRFIQKQFSINPEKYADVWEKA